MQTFRGYSVVCLPVHHQSYWLFGCQMCPLYSYSLIHTNSKKKSSKHTYNVKYEG